MTRLLNKNLRLFFDDLFYLASIVASSTGGLRRSKQIHFELGSINSFNGAILGCIATIVIEWFVINPTIAIIVTK